MSSELNGDESSADEVAVAIMLARPKLPANFVADVLRFNVADLGKQQPAAPGAPLTVGALPWPRVGRYELLAPLGSGAMGEVWAGVDTELDRKVALKKLRPRSAHHQDRLRREAQALALLSHPNVVAVYGIEKDHGQLFIAMELIEGQTLAQWQERRPAPEWADCVRAYIDAGRGLAAAHKAGLVHRDFKPSNCMVDGQGRVKVLDFGLVSRADGGTPSGFERSSSDCPTTSEVDDALSRSLTETGIVVGTYAYMAPEAMAGADITESSDQFSFCVSLYEAVYSHRPFIGATRSALVDAVTQGRVRAAPRGTAVPGRLRRILLRGLEVDVKRRWPSIDALLVELDHLVTPRTGRSVALLVTGGGLLVGVAGVGIAFGAQHDNDAAGRCSGAASHLAAVWNDERREQVWKAIAATNLPFAKDSWGRVETRLDRYSEAWVGKHTEVCEATSVRQEQSEDEHDLRMSCLREQKEALAATVGVLLQADARVVEGSVPLVLSLPSPARCDDVDRLRAKRERLPPPEDPKVARQVDATRKRLAAVRAESAAGRYSRALESIGPIVEQAKALGYAPLLAEAMLSRGEVRDQTGLYNEAKPDLREAYALAVELRHDDVELSALLSLTTLLISRESNHDEALQWCDVLSPLVRRSGSVAHRGAMAGVLGRIHTEKGNYADAESHYREVVALFGEDQGAFPRQLAMGLNDLGLSLSFQGRFEEAQQQQERALKLREELLGGEHPAVAMSLNNLGYALEGQGRYEEAERHYRRSLRIREVALGPSDPYTIRSVEGLGALFFVQGQYEEAERHYLRVLRAREQADSPEAHAVAIALTNVGLVLSAQGKDDDAGKRFALALEMQDELFGGDHPALLTTLLGMAEVALRRGDFQSARDYAERAVSIGEAHTTAPSTLAGAHFILARALWSDAEQRGRAVELAQLAYDAYSAAGREDGRAEVEQWQTKHHVP
jgi:eukaryotic-like serine/threonine-protein kinase